MKNRNDLEKLLKKLMPGGEVRFDPDVCRHPYFRDVVYARGEVVVDGCPFRFEVPVHDPER